MADLVDDEIDVNAHARLRRNLVQDNGVLGVCSEDNHDEPG